MADEPDLRKGDSGEWVQYLQQLLQNAGYWPYDADGNFGDEVEQAVMQFQSAYGLSADGVVGATTWGALTGQSTSDGNGGGAGGVSIDLSQFPTIAKWAYVDATEDGAKQEFASLGVDESVVGDDAYA